MELQQLKSFVAVVRSGSISNATKIVHLSQSAVSRQIQALEQEFEANFFERVKPKNAKPTEEGVAFYDLVAPIVEELSQLRSKFKEGTGKPVVEQITIATHTSVMLYLLPKVIHRFKQKYPTVELAIVNRRREDLLQMVKAGEADLGITSLSKPLEGIDYIPFAKFKRLLLLPKNHPLSKKKKLTLEDLSVYPLIVAPVGSNTRAVIDRVFAAVGGYKLAMEATGHDAVKAYVRMRLGISVINEYYITKRLEKGLVVEDASALFGFAERGIVVRRGKHRGKALRVLIELLETGQNQVKVNTNASHW